MDYTNILNQVTYGDSLRLLLGLPDRIAASFVLDPPYSSGGMYRGDRIQKTNDKYLNSDGRGDYPEFYGDGRDQRSYGYWLSLIMAEGWRVSRNAATVMMFTDWRQYGVASDALQAGGWIWRGTIIWDKSEGARPQPGRPRAQCEYVLWGSKGEWWNNETSPFPGLIRCVVKPAEKNHTTAKPLPLMRFLLSICQPGLVIDPFAGGGATLKAAAEKEWPFIGFELSEEYVQINSESIRRVIPHIQQEMFR